MQIGFKKNVDGWSASAPTSPRGQRLSSLFMLGLAILQLIVGAVLLIWGQHLYTQNVLRIEDASRAVIEGTPSAPLGENQSRLLHLTGTAVSEDKLEDDVFGVFSTALRMDRIVELYAKRKDLADNRKDGKDHYKIDWGPSNGGFLPGNQTFLATHVDLGSFHLSAPLIAALPEGGRVDLKEGTLSLLPPNLKARAKIKDGYFYFPTSNIEPQIGDQRVSFKVLHSGQTISVMAMQDENQLKPFHTRGGDFMLVELGAVSSDDMINQAKNSGTLGLWSMRAIGAVLILIGGQLFSRSTRNLFFPRMLPVVGYIAGFALFLAISLVSLGIGWLIG